ncbi:MAG: hypothetical protein HY367_01435, partial [Candidatus Aenigmarchaeota archaeon]|nr:hypothetical protein [Candidatus Aenigmarchaeota archaeon]
MKKMIAITILLALVPLVSAQERVYQVELEYSSGAVAMAGIGLADSFPQDIRNPPDSGYRIELLSQQGETIFQHTFNFPLDTYIEPSQQCYDTQTLEYRPELCPPGKQPYLRLDHATAIINIPFSPAGKEINLYDPGGRLMLTSDVEGFSCGNLVCDARETRASCPADCAE